jgi:hypothetical protein
MQQAPSAGTVPKKALLGLVTRKERWGLTWRGRLLIALTGVALAVLFVLGIHPFLAQTRRVSSSVLAVEGWISPSAMREAADQFKSGGFQTLCTTGGPTGAHPGTTDVSDTFAGVAADRLVKFGISLTEVHPVPAQDAHRDRTYASAVALREWLKKQGISVKELTVVTEGVHGRRTRIMYEEAFGEGVSIGVISARNPEYDPDRWWRYSEGVKEVVSEGAAYLYARLLFKAE